MLAWICTWFLSQINTGTEWCLTALLRLGLAGRQTLTSCATPGQPNFCICTKYICTVLAHATRQCCRLVQTRLVARSLGCSLHSCVRAHTHARTGHAMSSLCCVARFFSATEAVNNTVQHIRTSLRCRVKFGAFYEYLASHQDHFDRIATGHYAKIIRSDDPDEPVRLALVPDAVKDQTYFLAHLTQQQLSKVMFPLGQFTKVLSLCRYLQRIFRSIYLGVACNNICYKPELREASAMQTALIAAS